MLYKISSSTYYESIFTRIVNRNTLDSSIPLMLAHGFSVTMLSLSTAEMEAKEGVIGDLPLQAERLYREGLARKLSSMGAFVVDWHPDESLEMAVMQLVTGRLGGVESLVSLPAETSHWELDPEERGSLGISDGHVRLSVGIEDLTDLMSDLERGLERV